ncbi:MAG TPA: response regulator transcription factor [Prolixibacteraceae bacterium]|nr:response regulator transcription factor [Prolixibacteraceae bacterium]
MDTKKKILLVDGDRNFSNTVAKALDPKKYSFFYAHTGSLGIQLALDHRPDLIFYNLALDPIDGCDVFKAFKTTSSKDASPVFFLSDKANNETNSHSIDLNEKDVIVKPDNTNDFIQSIEACLQDSRIGMEERTDDFNTLFQLSPYGILVFARDRVLKANSFLWDRIGRDQESCHLNLEEIFERSSWLKIRNWIKHYSKDSNSVFNDQIVLKDRLGEEYPMNLKIAEFKAVGGTVQFIGFVSQSMSEKNEIVNYQLANEVCNMLKRENLAITESLEKKITRIIKSRTVDNHDQSKLFFTKRENEVLRLTMEGLSIKVIADKLSISSRTVEKYRTKLMEKSGAKNIVEVIVFSLKNNLIKI